MVLGGLWHGAGWTFIIWGALHGSYLVVNHFWHGAKKRLGFREESESIIARMTARAVTFGAVVVGWVFFRSESFEAALSMLQGMAGLNGITVPAYVLTLHPDLEYWLSVFGIEPMLGGGARFFFTYLWVVCLGIIAFAFPNTQEICTAISDASKGASDRGGTERGLRYFVWSPNPIWAVGMAVVAAMGMLAMNRVSEFLYFQF